MCVCTKLTLHDGGRRRPTATAALPEAGMQNAAGEVLCLSAASTGLLLEPLDYGPSLWGGEMKLSWL